jgi:hypothetical protein
MDKEAIIKELENCYAIVKESASKWNPESLKHCIDILNTLYSIRLLNDKA